MNKIDYYLSRIKFKILKRFFKDQETFSMVGEDLLINHFLNYKEKGCYIDIGSNHPTINNNSYKFYLKGWRGLNVEPSKRSFLKLIEQRPEDINLNCACGLGGKIDFYETENDVGATCSPELVKERNYRGYQTLTVESISLEDIFKKIGKDYVDFISIDVEGFESEVLKSNNWQEFKAGLICIEGAKYDHLEDCGYKKIFFDGINSYYKLKI